MGDFQEPQTPARPWIASLFEMRSFVLIPLPLKLAVLLSPGFCRNWTQSDDFLRPFGSF